MTEKEMYEIIKNGNWKEKWDLSKIPELPVDLMYKLAEDEKWEVREKIAQRPDLPEDLTIRLCCDREWAVRIDAFRRPKAFKSLTEKDLETAYDLIYNSEYVNKEDIEYTYDYLSEEFPELSRLINIMKDLLLRKM